MKKPNPMDDPTNPRIPVARQMMREYLAGLDREEADNRIDRVCLTVFVVVMTLAFCTGAVFGGHLLVWRS